LTSGSDSVKRKQYQIEKLLKLSSPEEAKFIIRWLVGNLKTGAGEKTLISALSRALAVL
jgi:ATP-dependent DNA ligase